MAGIYVVLASTSPEKKQKGLTAFIVEKGTPGLPHRQAHREDGPARLGHHRADPRGGGGARRAAPGRDRPRLLRHPEDPGPRAHRHRRLGGGHRPGARWRRRAPTPSSACSSASRSPSSRPSSTCWPTWPPSSTPPGCWSGAPPGCRTRRRSTTRESSIAKYYAARAAMRACNAAVQIHGGYGYTREFPVERYLRDAKLARDRRGDQRGAEDGDRPRAPQGTRVTERRPAVAAARIRAGDVRAAARLMRDLDDGRPRRGRGRAARALPAHRPGLRGGHHRHPRARASRRWSTR